MAVFKRGKTWWYEFWFAERRIRESAKTHSKTVAKDAEKKRRRELEEGFNDVAERREQRVQALSAVATAFLAEYKLKHRSGVFAAYAIGHITTQLGNKMIVDITATTVREYQTARLNASAAPKTINEEVGFLLRILGERGDAIRAQLRREHSLKLKVRNAVGRAFNAQQKQKLMQAVERPTGSTLPSGEKRTRKNPGRRSPFIKPALALALNCGMRHAEIRTLTWSQIDLDKRLLTVGRSKTDAGEGRTIPLNDALFAALADHARWYTARFGIAKPEWYVFPGRIGKPLKGSQRPYDTTRPVTSFKTAWRNVKKQAGVTGRLHDARHTLITELGENGAGEQTIMEIAGHVSPQMLKRYSHIRMEAKRRALDVINKPPNQPPPEDVQPKEAAPATETATVQ